MWKCFYTSTSHFAVCCSVARLCRTLCDPVDSSPSLCPGVCSDSCPLSRWCYLTIHPLPPASPFAFDLFQHHCLFQALDIRVLELQLLASVLPMNIQGWFPLGLTGFISVQYSGVLGVFSSTTIQKHSSLALSFLCSPTFTSVHDCWKNHSFD